MKSRRRSRTVFVKNETTQEAYADYFENKDIEKNKNEKKYGILSSLLNYFKCFTT